MDYKVFMSYRRSDSEGITGRIYDRIIQNIPKENVFIDVGSISKGADFVEVMTKQVSEADIVLAVIGTNWLNAREESGKRRIDNPLDPVRLELSKAIEERKLIIPLLIGRAEMPSIRKLPDCLATLSRRNAERVTHENFHMDVERLIQSIDLAFAHYNSSRSPVDQAKPHQARAATNQTDPNKIEQSEFDSIRQRGDAESLRIHISKWPKGVTLVAAVTLLEQLDWEYVANSQDPEMLKWFLAAYPQTSRHEQAQKLIDRYANINHSTSLAVGSGKLDLKSEARSYRSDEGTKNQVSRRTFLLSGLTITLGTAYLLYRFGGIRAPLALRPIVTVTSSTKFYSCAFSPDGSQFVTGAYEDVVRIWDANQGAALDSFGKLSGPIRSVNYSRDGQFIGATSGDNSVLVWRTSNHALERRFTGHSATASSVEFSPDGLTLLTGSEDGTVRLWDLKSGRSLSVMENGKTYVFSAVFSPDGNRIAASLSDGTVAIWNAKSFAREFMLTGHQDYVRSSSFSHDGKRIVTASEDKTVRVWDSKSGRELVKLIGHTDYVNFAEFSPDGDYIVSAASDSTVRLWDGKRGNQLDKVNFHRGIVTSARFSADGRRVLTVSYDGTAVVSEL